ncbi:MAG: N(G),N(G)-dimethylarginine dimethylaminohydrolase [candidate division WOR-3 bacterium]|nr:MAG: N(G),N(G)-dimethylarginine dimethylaminohydrolase [candidate division WOR-3 bacterium]
MFTKAIVRTPGRSIINGVTTAHLGKPDYRKALEQHGHYIQALKSCGLEVIVMPSDENYPDSTFVEDCAVLTEKCAIVGRLGIDSRQGEEVGVEEILRKYYSKILRIEEPGTLEGGDVLRVGDHFYIGITKRTNLEGARQLSDILNGFGYTSSTVPVTEVLHLKTGVGDLGEGCVAVAGEFAGNAAFAHLKRVFIDDEERNAANCARINEYVLMPGGYTKAKKKIENAGFPVIEIDISEFQKIDGGISCLSLRFLK